MSFLRAAIDRMDALASAGLAKPPVTQPDLQRQLAKLDASIGEAEPVVELRPFLRSAAEKSAEALPRFKLNRVLRGAWCDPEFDTLGSSALDRALKDPRRSSDQAMINGYLTYFPIGGPSWRSLQGQPQVLPSGTSGHGERGPETGTYLLPHMGRQRWLKLYSRAITMRSSS